MQNFLRLRRGKGRREAPGTPEFIAVLLHNLWSAWEPDPGFPLSWRKHWLLGCKAAQSLLWWFLHYEWFFFLLYRGTASQLRGSSNAAGLLAHAEPVWVRAVPLLLFTSGHLTAAGTSDHKSKFLTCHAATLPHQKRALHASAHFPWLHLHKDLVYVRKNSSLCKKIPLIITSMNADTWKQEGSTVLPRPCHAAEELHAAT